MGVAGAINYDPVLLIPRTNVDTGLGEPTPAIVDLFSAQLYILCGYTSSRHRVVLAQKLQYCAQTCGDLAQNQGVKVKREGGSMGRNAHQDRYLGVSICLR